MWQAVDGPGDRIEWVGLFMGWWEHSANRMPILNSNSSAIRVSADERELTARLQPHVRTARVAPLDDRERFRRRRDAVHAANIRRRPRRRSRRRRAIVSACRISSACRFSAIRSSASCSRRSVGTESASCSCRANVWRPARLEEARTRAPVRRRRRLRAGHRRNRRRRAERSGLQRRPRSSTATRANRSRAARAHDAGRNGPLYRARSASGTTWRRSCGERIRAAAASRCSKPS